jgi:hypothetical protein
MRANKFEDELNREESLNRLSVKGKTLSKDIKQIQSSPYLKEMRQQITAKRSAQMAIQGQILFHGKPPRHDKTANGDYERDATPMKVTPGNFTLETEEANFRDSPSVLSRPDYEI